jgi:transcription antitermination protein NusB
VNENAGKKPKGPPIGRGERRSAARLAAVQALYQMDLTAKSLNEIFAEFESHWMGREIEGDQYKPAEVGLFHAIVKGVIDHQRQIDPLVDDTLAVGWPLKRVEAVIRAILRAGAYELRHEPETPTKVVISEYVDMAAAFYEGGDEIALVNAVLDRIGKQVRVAG